MRNIGLMSPIGPICAIAPDTLRTRTARILENEDEEKRPLAPDRDFGEIQFLVADVDDAVVLEKEIGSE
jgi:hypothetical protein